jgi:hypothetical protein
MSLHIEDLLTTRTQMTRVDVLSTTTIVLLLAIAQYGTGQSFLMSTSPPDTQLYGVAGRLLFTFVFKLV